MVCRGHAAWTIVGTGQRAQNYIASMYYQIACFILMCRRPRRSFGFFFSPASIPAGGWVGWAYNGTGKKKNRPRHRRYTLAMQPSPSTSLQTVPYSVEHRHMRHGAVDQCMVHGASLHAARADRRPPTTTDFLVHIYYLLPTVCPETTASQYSVRTAIHYHQCSTACPLAARCTAWLCTV